MRPARPPRKAASSGLLNKLMPTKDEAPADAAAVNREAVALIRAGRRDEALQKFAAGCRAHPLSAELWSNRGRLNMEIGDFTQAAECLNKAVELRPLDPNALNNLGDLCYRQKRYEQAAHAFRRALAAQADHAAANRNLALTEQAIGQQLDALGLSRDAAAHFDIALAHAPDDIDLLVAAALNQRHLGANAVAIARLRTASSLAEAAAASGACTAQRLAKVRYTLGTTLLRAGLYEEGWPLYELRRAAFGHAPATPTGVQAWDGTTVGAGSHILVECEQGFGDTIQFCRFAPWLIGRLEPGSEPGLERGSKHHPERGLERGFDRVTLVVQPSLVDLLARSLGPSITVTGSRQAAPGPFTHHALLPSLPALLRVTLNDLAAHGAYLRAEQSRVAGWRRREQRAEPALRVGIAWGGSSELTESKQRNVEFDALRGLFDVAGVRWFSLQKEADPRLLAGTPVIDWMADVRDFDDTAALMETLDLVISVDTSVVHLAGALGVRAWLLNRYQGEWRWLTQSGQSAWYPSVEIFHQERFGDWQPTLERVRARLEQSSAGAR